MNISMKDEQLRLRLAGAVRRTGSGQGVHENDAEDDEKVEVEDVGNSQGESKDNA